MIKLRHESTRFHLHSHVIKWGGGSGQQSVTAHGGEDDQGSMWIVSLLPCVSLPVVCMYAGAAAVWVEHMCMCGVCSCVSTRRVYVVVVVEAAVHCNPSP